MAHPYFEGLHNEATEPVCREPFDWSWDNFEPTKEILQDMVYDEGLKFHPEKAPASMTKKKADIDFKAKLNNL